jgi:hypothetical protein
MTDLETATNRWLDAAGILGIPGAAAAHILDGLEIELTRTPEGHPVLNLTPVVTPALAALRVTIDHCAGRLGIDPETLTFDVRDAISHL